MPPVTTFSFWRKYSTLNIFVFECTSWQTTRTYLTGSALCVFTGMRASRVVGLSCGLAPVLIWTNDSFGAGSHLELRQSPWPPLIANKRRRHNEGSTIWSDSGKVEDSQRLAGEELHQHGSGTNMGCVWACVGENKAIWREQSFSFFFSSRFQAGSCDP